MVLVYCLVQIVVSFQFVQLIVTPLAKTYPITQ